MSDFVPYIEMFDKLNMQKCPINIIILSIFRLNNSWSHRLFFFRRGLYQAILLSI